MDSKNRLNEVPLAHLNEEELRQIRELEQKFGDKYFLMALKKDHFTS
ncbi:MAG: hypothetical protein MJB12_17010 [Firmicutes bacterium]|nr:hypothetical protein [Bacillota bacterium]